jgi:hypothetical protein
MNFGYNLVIAGVAQLVERNLAKVEVESSRLFSRSKFLGSNGTEQVPFSFVSITFWYSASPVDATRRVSKEVMQRIANPFRTVRFRYPPPVFYRNQHLRNRAA